MDILLEALKNTRNGLLVRTFAPLMTFIVVIIFIPSLLNKVQTYYVFGLIILVFVFLLTISLKYLRPENILLYKTLNQNPQLITNIIVNEQIKFGYYHKVSPTRNVRYVIKAELSDKSNDTIMVSPRFIKPILEFIASTAPQAKIQQNPVENIGKII